MQRELIDCWLFSFDRKRKMSNNNRRERKESDDGSFGTERNRLPAKLI